MQFNKVKGIELRALLNGRGAIAILTYKEQVFELNGKLLLEAIRTLLSLGAPSHSEIEFWKEEEVALVRTVAKLRIKFCTEEQVSAFKKIFLAISDLNKLEYVSWD